MRLPDIDRVAEIIESAAKEELLPRFRSLAAHEVRQKTGPGDLVTVADEACEKRLSALLTALLPGSVVVGEEGTSADPRRMALIGGDDPVWIIDPLDGTYNFAHGDDRFASIVALADRGRTVAGWIHDPVRKLTGKAAVGEGAFINGRRLTVADPASSDEMVVILTDFLFPTADQPAVQRIKASTRGVYNERCSGIEYLQLTDGKAHALITNGLKPWDHAAGALMHSEAGGYAAMLDGAAYGPTVQQGLLILAPDPSGWQALRRLWTFEP